MPFNACEYLGQDLDVFGGCAVLEEGQHVRLPLVLAPGIVLFPGHTLPLHLSREARTTGSVFAALDAEAPLSRLLLVAHTPILVEQDQDDNFVACVAEVKQMRSSGGAHNTSGTVDVIARGRQRVLVDMHSLRQARVEHIILAAGVVMPEQGAGRLPWALRDGYGALHPTLARTWDVTWLCTLAKRLLLERMPHAVPAATLGATRDPVALSYLLSADLPVPSHVRHGLLTKRDPADRLRLLISMLQTLNALACQTCGSKLFSVPSILAMTVEGAGGTFVNAHGHLHDLVTVSSLDSPGCVEYEGGPETAFSWFPGYAWTICTCASCGQHLGWRFDATRPDLQPTTFWGLRRDTLRFYVPSQGPPMPFGEADEDGEEDDDGEGEGGDELEDTSETSSYRSTEEGRDTGDAG